MKVFVAGGTGAIGKRLIPLLCQRGHEVVATTRFPAKAALVQSLGAQPVVIDALDDVGILQAVKQARPDVIVHQLTALSRFKNLKRFDAEFAETNRLRTAGLDYLLQAARAAGARRVVAQSYTGWPNIRSGGAIKTEEDPLDPHPPAAMSETLRAIHYLETTLTGATDLEGLALRYGSLYGPGTAFASDGVYITMIRKRQFPIVGGGTGIWSFIHVDDAAAATVAAIERGAPGIYNIVDDEPAPVSVWLPYLASLIGAKPPRRLPVWLARFAVGDPGISMMTLIRGSSNSKAKRELGWQPRFRSWRKGFRLDLAGEQQSDAAQERSQAA